MLRRHARFYPRPMADDRAIELVGLQEEAQRLADRVAIIRAARIVADGTPAEIGTARAPARIRFLLPPALDGEPLPAPAGRVEREGDRVVVHTSRPTADAHLLTGWAAARGVELPELAIERPSLEEAYLALTESDNGAVR